MHLMKRKKPPHDILNCYAVILLLNVIAFALAYGSGLRIHELVNISHSFL